MRIIQANNQVRLLFDYQGSTNYIRLWVVRLTGSAYLPRERPMPYTTCECTLPLYLSLQTRSLNLPLCRGEWLVLSLG
jgi:hypothetical protein